MEIFTDPQGYANWYRVHERIYDSEKKLVSIFKPRNCLDVGSGPGIFHEVFEGSTVSLDLSIFMLKSIQGEDRVLADAMNLPFRDNAFECVFTSVTVCFVSDYKQFIKELKRVTKKRIIVCYVPRDSPFGEYYEELGKKGHKYYSHAHFVSKKELYDALSSEGLKVVKTLSTLFYKPTDEEKVDEIKEGDSGSFVCVEAVK